MPGGCGEHVVGGRQRVDAAREALDEIFRPLGAAQREVGDRLNHRQRVLDTMIEFLEQELPRFFLRFSLSDVVGDGGVTGQFAIGRANGSEAEDDFKNRAVFSPAARIDG
jgi:hypothetical protein